MYIGFAPESELQDPGLCGILFDIHFPFGYVPSAYLLFLYCPRIYYHHGSAIYFCMSLLPIGQRLGSLCLQRFSCALVNVQDHYGDLAAPHSDTDPLYLRRSLMSVQDHYGDLVVPHSDADLLHFRISAAILFIDLSSTSAHRCGAATFSDIFFRG